MSELKLRPPKNRSFSATCSCEAREVAKVKALKTKVLKMKVLKSRYGVKIGGFS
jgi:hypothetical protein